MEVNRISIKHSKLVYVVCASKKIKYPKGGSPIVYIGTTRKGVSRVAGSAAFRSKTILRLHGVKSFHVRIVTCGVRQHVRTWHKLERALLLVFRDRYGSVPRCNTAGKNVVENNEFSLFARKRVGDILNNLAERRVPERVISDQPRLRRPRTEKPR